VAHRGALTKISMVLLVGVVLAVHLGIGAALLRQHWAWWTIVAIAVVVALKLVVARHLFAALDGHRSQRR
jgi:bacteriorhodopsin